MLYTNFEITASGFLFFVNISLALLVLFLVDMDTIHGSPPGGGCLREWRKEDEMKTILQHVDILLVV